MGGPNSLFAALRSLQQPTQHGLQKAALRPFSLGRLTSIIVRVVVLTANDTPPMWEGETVMSVVQFDRDQMARWYADRHLQTDRGIVAVYYLPAGAPEREIRFS